MDELSRAQETPIKDLLAKIPADARMMYNGDGFGMNIPIGARAAKALAEIERLEAALAKNANAAPQDATDWEGVAADQAMTIAMMKVDYQQLQTLVTSQGIALMEQEEWQKEAARYRWLRDKATEANLDNLCMIPKSEWDTAIDTAMQQEQKP